ncbi:hypothetical protein BU25DRAFT_442095 [Macroventuria anomochaeta]|uniref:Uncharacterized protein n=1 Tax=Macroventuria anomochaeta TaxID=301207 RepID=A0ACB6RRD0_9PLEO|nr:uncharacterized protein BU25DRAFT_442095 [Macroventuria anomochaeta]KAF2624451.1 hypothetical protein BU25DRAFT_442095 [Macroventuria anomochaeta]
MKQGRSSACSARLWLAVTSSQVANLNISANVASEYGCNATCYKALSAGLAIDAAAYGALYNEDFYATADNFSASVPGDILKFQPINSDDLSGSVPKGTTAYRLQYTSIDLFGNKVPVTGFVAFPYANRTNVHLFQTVAWAHGTSGVFKGCAPSVMPSLYEYASWSHLIDRGYTVVAIDYAGLGNDNTGHPYVALSAHANDVFYSVAAMSVGYSQGGGTVYSAPAGKYLGTIAQAPGVFMGSTALAASESPKNFTSDVGSSRSVFGELGWALIGVQNIYPNKTVDWIDSTFKKRLELAKKAQACYASMESLATDLNINHIVSLSANTTAEQAQRIISLLDELSAVGVKKSCQPILVVQGLEDVSVLPQVVESAYNATCQAGSEVHLQLYLGLDHDLVIPASAPYFLQRMDDRFDSVATQGGCSRETVEP